MANEQPVDRSSGVQAGGQSELTERTQRAAEHSLAHADDLVTAAKLLLEPYPHLAYHFGVLALEEVGRSTLIVVQELARSKAGSSRRLDRDVEDHVRKLFWALWGPSFERELITGKQIEQFRGLAQAIHDTRKAGLYYGGADAAPPKKAIPAEEARVLVELAEARLGMARAQTWVEPDSEQAADLAWFIEATEDADKRPLIMGGASMKKLVELGGVPAWIRWLREEFEASDKAAREMTQRELARSEPSAEEAAQRKWRVKCRFESGSHSVRPQPLRWWNGMDSWIKLHPVSGKPSQLIVEIEFPKQVSVHALWWTALGEAQQLLVALNIGSMGFFWFDMPEKVNQFYEEIRDLETDERVVVQRSPALRIDWGHNVLSDDLLKQVALCFVSMPGPDDQAQHAPFDHYLTGLGFLAKTDVIMQFEANAFEQFYQAFKETARIYGEWDGTGSFLSAFDEILSMHLEDQSHRAPYVDAARLIEDGRQSELKVDLSDVGGLKVLTDAFLLKHFRGTAGDGEAAVPPNPSEPKQ